MKLKYDGFSISENSPQGEYERAVAAFPSREKRQIVLAYTPVARLNPYQALLYKKFAEAGITVVPILKHLDFDELASNTLEADQLILHLHWTSWVLSESETADQTREATDAFLQRLRTLKDSGWRIVWTVHNVYPHDARFTEEESRLQSKLVQIADVVHVMSDDSGESMTGIVDIPENKELVSPHPSYVGAYPDYVSRFDARSTLGIGADELVFCLVGALKKYKGLGRIQSAFERLIDEHPDRKFRLIVAGGADDNEHVSAEIERMEKHPRVLVSDSPIHVERMQYLLRASDVGIVHYLRSLNSGAAFLYKSFGLPVIASDTPTFRRELSEVTTEFVAGDSEADLMRAMEKSLRFFMDREIRTALKEEMERLDPNVVSLDFATQLKAKLGLI